MRIRPNISSGNDVFLADIGPLKGRIFFSADFDGPSDPIASVPTDRPLSLTVRVPGDGGFCELKAHGCVKIKAEVFSQIRNTEGRVIFIAVDKGDQMLEARFDHVYLELANVVESSENNIIRKFSAHFGI